MALASVPMIWHKGQSRGTPSRAPEASITELNPPGGERLQPDGLLRNNAGGMNEHTTV
jgi:hypothetical protein